MSCGFNTESLILLPTVVEPFVTRVGVLADEGHRDLCFCNIVAVIQRFFSRIPSFS